MKARANQNLGTIFFAYAAGFSSSFLLLSLAALGAYSMPSNTRFQRLFMPFITLCLFLFIFASPYTMQGRILYALPIVPLSALGFKEIARLVHVSLGNDESANHVLVLVATYVVVTQLVYLLRSMATLAELLS